MGVGVGVLCVCVCAWVYVLCYIQSCARTVRGYGPSKHGLTVDFVNDNVRPSIRNLGTVKTVHDGTVDGPYIARRPKNGILNPKTAILAAFSSFLSGAPRNFLN